jgi:serine/threonine protein kinase
LFKAPKNLEELSKLNCGMYYGYPQIGKCFTVYPRNSEHCVTLARQLHELTINFDGPVIPFDRRLKAGSNVFYRYGSFKRQSVHDMDGTELLAIRSPDGVLVPDSRTDVGDELEGRPDPFLQKKTFSPSSNSSTSLLKTRFRVFKALSQRGKGGVYKAIDLGSSKPRFCILKEGRKHGESGWDGRDGFWRIRTENKNLSALRKLNIDVPEVYGSFQTSNNFYVATEFISGVSLEKLLRLRQRRLPISQVVRYSIQLANILSQFHGNGWVWRDCKPANLIVSGSGFLRPIDFEGACRIDELDPLPLGTLLYLPENTERELMAPAHPSIDLFAMGVVIHYLLTGHFPTSSTVANLRKNRRGIPTSILSVVTALLSSNADARPSAQLVARELENTSSGG